MIAAVLKKRNVLSPAVLVFSLFFTVCPVLKDGGSGVHGDGPYCYCGCPCAVSDVLSDTGSGNSGKRGLDFLSCSSGSSFFVIDATLNLMPYRESSFNSEFPEYDFENSGSGRRLKSAGR